MRIALMLDTATPLGPREPMRPARSRCSTRCRRRRGVRHHRPAKARTGAATTRKKAEGHRGRHVSDGAAPCDDGLLEIDERLYKKADDDGRCSGSSQRRQRASTGSREKEFLKWAPLLGPRGITVHALVLKTPKGSGMPEIVAENLTQNTGGRYDVMNTSTALPEKMKALGEKLALDHRNMRNWYEVDIQTDSDVAPIDVAVAREGVRLQISNSRHGK